MKIAAIAGLILLAGVLVAASHNADTTISTNANQVRVESLYQAELARDFAPDRDVLVDFVTIPPNGTLERHWHPGEEFHYYLEGDATVEIEGQPTIVGKPGTVGHVPYKKWHRAVAGPKGAKVVVFRVHTHGQPVRSVEAPSEKK